MKDYRVGNEKSYYKWHIPGILRGSVGVVATKEHPLYICYFCGEKAGQLRDENKQFISRGCRKIECRTLASMHSQEDWGKAPELFTREY